MPRAYIVKDLDGAEPAKDQFVRTREDARAIVRAEVPVFRKNIAVKQVEIPSDLNDLLRALNGELDWDEQALRSWRGTIRGGLVEVDVDTAIPLHGDS